MSLEPTNIGDGDIFFILLRTFFSCFLMVLSADPSSADISYLLLVYFVRCVISCGHFTPASCLFCPLRLRLRTFHTFFLFVLSAASSSADISHLLLVCFVRCVFVCGHFTPSSCLFCPLRLRLRTFHTFFLFVLSAASSSADISHLLLVCFVRCVFVCGHFTPSSCLFCPLRLRLRTFHTFFLFVLSAASSSADISHLLLVCFVRCVFVCGHFTPSSCLFCPLRLRLRTFHTFFLFVLSAASSSADISHLLLVCFVRCVFVCGHFTPSSCLFCPLRLRLRTFHTFFLFVLSAASSSADISHLLLVCFVRCVFVCGHFTPSSCLFCPLRLRLRTFHTFFLFVLSAASSSADISHLLLVCFVRCVFVCGHFTPSSCLFCPLRLRLRTFHTFFLFVLSAASSSADISHLLLVCFVRCVFVCGHFTPSSCLFCPLRLRLRTFHTFFLFVLSAASSSADISHLLLVCFVRCVFVCGHFTPSSCLFCPLRLRLRTFHTFFLFVLSAAPSSADISSFLLVCFVR